MAAGSRHAYFGGRDVRVAPPGAVPAGGRLAGVNAVPVAADVTATVCAGIRRDGQPCGAAPVRDTNLCAGHSRAVK